MRSVAQVSVASRQQVAPPQIAAGPIETSMPSRRATTTCSTDGAAATASSATAFIAHRLPAAPEAVRREQHLDAGIVQPRRHRVCAVAGEQRQHDAAELDRREEGDDQFGAHRHEQRDAVAGLRRRARAVRSAQRFTSRSNSA